MGPPAWEGPVLQFMQETVTTILMNESTGRTAASDNLSGSLLDVAPPGPTDTTPMGTEVWLMSVSKGWVHS